MIQPVKYHVLFFLIKYFLIKVSVTDKSLKSDLKPHFHFQRKKYHPSSPAIIRMQYLTGFSKQKKTAENPPRLKRKHTHANTHSKQNCLVTLIKVLRMRTSIV